MAPVPVSPAPNSGPDSLLPPTGLHRVSRSNVSTPSSRDSIEDEIRDQLSLASGGSSSSEDEEDLFSSNAPDNPTAVRPSIAMLTKVATNREAYGTWNHPLDFTLTLVGYVIGVHNFFRFPQMCYKYGTLTFLVPYVILMGLLGFPAIFMETTIGQFYGVGSATAFRQLAPILTGVSYILAWNSFLNCWIYGLILTWTRSYSGDSLSCLKGWMGCDPGHYFNTPHCYTAIMDDCCTGLASISDSEFCPEWMTAVRESADDQYTLMYYDFQCVSMISFCALHNWTFISDKTCLDSDGKTKHSIYERRTHATSEYLYGFVLGLRKVFVGRSQTLEQRLCKAANKPTDPKQPLHPEVCSNEAVATTGDYRSKVFQDKKNVQKFWSGNATFMQLDPESSSFIQLPTQALTTVLFITFFLFVDLLSVSIVTYVMSSVPFVILITLCVHTMSLKGSILGINDMLSLRGIESLWSSGSLWADALIQVVITCGVGNGALVSLASFNKYHHTYIFDAFIVTLLNVTTSLLATFICFCSIGHYVQDYGISTGFEFFIRPESSYSSVDFGFLVYSIFLTIIDGNDFETLAAFFMLSSFPTDTTIRLAQNMLDMAVQVLPRLRYHSAMALLATSFFYLVALLPITRNGGVILFFEFEYCAHRFAMPLVTLLEIVAVAWVYKVERLIDDAELLGVSIPFFRAYVTFSLKFFAPTALSGVLIYNALAESRSRINTLHFTDAEFTETLVGWIFSFTPTILLIFSVLKQLVSVPRSQWSELFVPMITWENVRTAGRKQRREKAKERRRFDAVHVRATLRSTTPKALKPRKSVVLPSDDPKVITNEDVNPSEAKRASKRQSRVNRKSTIPGVPTAYQTEADVPEKDAELVNMIRQSKLEPSNKKDAKGDKVSLGSSEVAKWKKFIFWNEIIAHLEDWPDRLDESEVESEGSSVDTSDEESEEERRRSGMLPIGSHHHHHHHQQEHRQHDENDNKRVQLQ